MYNTYVCMYVQLPSSFQDACRTKQIADGSIDNLTGLDGLAIVCIGLDTSIHSTGARSVLYRGLTRTHMMVAVVMVAVVDSLL